MRNAVLFVYCGFLGKGKQVGHWHPSFRIDIQSNTALRVNDTYTSVLNLPWVANIAKRKGQRLELGPKPS